MRKNNHSINIRTCNVRKFLRGDLFAMKKQNTDHNKERDPREENDLAFYLFLQAGTAYKTLGHEHMTINTY